MKDGLFFVNPNIKCSLSCLLHRYSFFAKKRKLHHSLSNLLYKYKQTLEKDICTRQFLHVFDKDCIASRNVFSIREMLQRKHTSWMTDDLDSQFEGETTRGRKSRSKRRMNFFLDNKTDPSSLWQTWEGDFSREERRSLVWRFHSNGCSTDHLNHSILRHDRLIFLKCVSPFSFLRDWRIAVASNPEKT